MESSVSRIVRDVELELRKREHATTYFRSLRSSYIDDLSRLARLHLDGRVLEIGGFPFCFTMCLKRLGLDLTTIDLAPTRARNLIHHYGLRVVECDIEREPLPFQESVFSTIVLCATLEHLRVDPLFALQEMRRVLKPHGLLYLTTPNLYRLGNVVSFALGRGLAFDPINEYGKLHTIGHMGHVREYTKSEVVRFLARAGFTSIEVFRRATPSRRGKVVDIVHRLVPGLRGELVVIARTGPDGDNGQVVPGKGGCG